jgi:peptidoglycan-associated lipoprotein
MKILKTITIALSSALLIAACSSTPKSTTTPDNIEHKVIAPKPDSRTVATVDVTPTDPLNDPKSPLANRSIYFDFDNYTVKSEFKPVISAHARYLDANRQRGIVIQGNADERGGAEYNLALGQKRAEAVRKSLAILGVSELRMEAISFGKEKPKALGSDESAWAENRRADIVYSGK